MIMLITTTNMMMLMMILTTTWKEQSFCLSSKSSSREMIQVFSGSEITVATPDGVDGDGDVDGDCS